VDILLDKLLAVVVSRLVGPEMDILPGAVVFQQVGQVMGSPLVDAVGDVALVLEIRKSRPQMLGVGCMSLAALVAAE